MDYALNHLDSIRTVDGEIVAVGRRIDEGREASPAALRDAFTRLHQSMVSADSDGIRAALNDLRDLIEGGVELSKSVKELNKLLKFRATLVDRERRMRLAAHNAMSREEAARHANALIAAVTRHVHDRRTLSAILADLRATIEVSARNGEL